MNNQSKSIYKVAGYLLTTVMLLVLTGCATMNPLTTVDEKRQRVLAMRNATLQDLYRVKPQTSSMIVNAPGYAVFSDANVNLVFASFSGGYGVVTNNKTLKETFMKMGEAGIGLGLGIKDFRSIFIFHNEAVMDRFINEGWQFGAHADAAAILNDQGDAVGGEIVLDNITIFQLTKAGLALQATVKGTRYWKDETLNR